MDYFAANDLAAFLTTSGTPTEVTTANTFDASYAAKSISLIASQVKTPQFINPTTGATVSLTDVWVHAELYYSATGSPSAQFIELLDSSGVPVVQLALNGSTTNVRINYWNGAAFVNGAAIFGIAQSTRMTIDIHAVAGLSGTVDVYINGSLAISQVGMNAAVDNFAFVRLNGSVSSTFFSQLLVSDSTTVGAKVASLTFNANGTNTAWANDYTNIVKLGYLDTTLISSSTLSDKESYGATDVTVPAGYAINSVWFNIRARLATASPTNIKPLIRIGSTDYIGSYNFPQLNTVSYGPSVAAFTADPSGGSWGATNLNAAELGFQSAA